MIRVQLSDRQTALEAPADWIVRVAAETLATQQVAAADIVVALLDDDAIQAVNREFLQHDEPTDVISFLYEARQVAAAPPGAPRGAGQALDGELLISAETARRRAADFHWRPEDELALYIVHGLLHLCGYDDLTDDERETMRDRERTVLKNWNLSPHYEG